MMAKCLTLYAIGSVPIDIQGLIPGSRFILYLNFLPSLKDFSRLHFSEKRLKSISMRPGKKNTFGKTYCNEFRAGFVKLPKRQFPGLILPAKMLIFKFQKKQIWILKFKNTDTLMR